MGLAAPLWAWLALCGGGPAGVKPGPPPQGACGKQGRRLPGGPVTNYFTNGQLPSAIGRKASAAGMVFFTVR